MRALYISQNGMAENLGQSQVLPYVRGLGKRGVEFDLVSFELPTLGAEQREEVAARLRSDGIRWHPLLRTMGGSLPVKLNEARRGAMAALRSALARRPDVVHGRSYFSTAICDLVGGVSRRSKVLFDCRGMIGDEYVDCGYWTKERLEYKLVKTYERRLFEQSDGVVVLTRALAGWLREHRVLGAKPLLEVVPCCVDMERFKPSDDARRRVREELGIGDRLALVYAGSLGTWYLEPEMARFADALRTRAQAAGRDLVFVCFTPSDAAGLRASLERSGFSGNQVLVRKIAPKLMPEYLTAGDVGLSFIQSCFSKKGSSPTKVAEYLACGNVVVVNGDIGDQADLASEKDSCVVLDGFSEAELERAARAAFELAAERPAPVRVAAAVATARRHFGLEEVGITRYARLYESLVRPARPSRSPVISEPRP